MDINLLFRGVMGKCGRVLRVLPPEDIGGSINQYLMDILETDTLPALDILVPYQYHVSFTISDLIPVSNTKDMRSLYDDNPTMPTYDDRYAIYRIPQTLTKGRGIMGIKSLIPDGGTAQNSGYSAFPTGVGVGTTMTNQFGRYSSAVPWERSAITTLSFADGLLNGQTNTKFRSYFYEPNILWLIKPYGGNVGTRMTAVFLLKNDPSLLTIPNVSFVKVQELFVLDVKARIFNEFGHLSEIDTPYGTVNLGIGEWSGAENERKELFDQLQSTAHYHNSAMKS